MLNCSILFVSNKFMEQSSKLTISMVLIFNIICIILIHSILQNTYTTIPIMLLQTIKSTRIGTYNIARINNSRHAQVSIQGSWTMKNNINEMILKCTINKISNNQRPFLHENIPRGYNQNKKEKTSLGNCMLQKTAFPELPNAIFQDYFQNI